MAKLRTYVLGLAALPLVIQCGLFSDDVTDRSYTSTNVSGHSHNLLIPASVIGSPSANGYTGITTEVSSHSHEIDLNQSDLQNIGARIPFSATTTNEDGHEHEFNFK